MNDHLIDQEARENYGPPPTSPLEALEHVLRVWKGTTDEMIVLLATSNVYRDAPRTALTLGDLRAIKVELDRRLQDIADLTDHSDYQQ